MKTGESSAEKFLEDRRTLGLIALIAICFFALANIPWNLDDYDQALQAYTSFEMVQDGHWFFQHTPHGLIAQKPPLVGWASAATFLVTRSWNVAWRLPGFLAAVAMAIILFRSAGNAYGAAPALIALSAFCLNLLSVRLATLVRTDMPLGLFLFLPGLLIWEKIRRREAWERRDRWTVFALFAASMLIKGPMNFAFILPGIVLFQLLVAKRSGATAWCGWWPWLASIGVILGWTICGIKFVPAFYQVVFEKEFLGRFGSTIHRAQPLLFYLPHLMQKFAPWSLLIVLFAFFAARGTKARARHFLRNTAPETLWLVFWSVGGIILMSLVPSKRVDRIYPVIPPLCLLLAAQMAQLLQNDATRSRVLKWGAAGLVFSIVFSGGYAAGKIVSNYRDHADNLENFSNQVNAEVAAHHWRFEVIEGKGGGSQGMLLYLQKLHFISPDEAVARWNAGALDALVVPKNQIDQLLPQLHGATVAPLRTVKRKSIPHVGFLLVTRPA
ncbi:MAG: ArnT family glycosyltransferase [Chthoniobacterales bacterium]